MKSISFRNFIVTATVIFICMLLLAASIFTIGRGFVVQQYKDQMENSAREVARTAAAIAETDSLSSWQLTMTLSAVSKATGNHIMVTDVAGSVMSCCDSAPLCPHIGMRVPPDVLQSLANMDFYESNASDLSGILKHDSIVIGVPVTREPTGLTIGFVIASVVEKNILSTWNAFYTIIILVFIAIFAAILIFVYWYSKHTSAPLEEISKTSRMFARGDFSARVVQTEDPSSEMGALIESFNKMADSLQSAEKRRSEFISNISHELRTPMTTIAGFADGILDGTIPHEDERKYLISIRDETRRLARLVRNMLNVSRMNASAADPSKRTDFDLTELVTQTLLSFETRAVEKNLDVDPQFPEQHIFVHAEKDGITQVIYNLLDNAVKFSDEGSCIVLRLFIEDGKACVSVKDRGQTIPPDDLPFIFDRFHKSDKSRSVDKDGVGLGLYLVKTIINGHDEDIAVKSEDGITEFVFTLPLAEEKKVKK